MAPHAIGVRHTLRVENLANLVGLMAIDASRKDVCFLFPKLAANGLAVNLLDLRMAFGAGGSDVAAGDGRGRVGVRKNQVGSVASGAVWSNRETLLQQCFAVNAFRIILENVVLRDGAIALDRRTFAVALSADKRNFQRSDSGARVFHRDDVVVAVAIDATRSEWVAAGNCFAMEGAGMLFLLRGMAGAADDLAGGLVGQFFALQVGMATGASEGAMDGRGEFFRIDE